MRLGTLSEVQYVSGKPGVPTDQSAQACTMAGGTWSPPGGLLAYGTCALDIGASLPAYCSIPYATSLFDACKLPATPADLNTYGSYTAFQVGQNSGLDAEQTLLAQDTAQSTQLLQDPSGTGNAKENCAYNAAANHPTLSQTIGPDLVCALGDPLNSGGLGFLVYGLLVLGVYIAVKR